MPTLRRSSATTCCDESRTEPLDARRRATSWAPALCRLTSGGGDSRRSGALTGFLTAPYENPVRGRRVHKLGARPQACGVRKCDRAANRGHFGGRSSLRTPHAGDPRCPALIRSPRGLARTPEVAPSPKRILPGLEDPACKPGRKHVRPALAERMAGAICSLRSMTHSRSCSSREKKPESSIRLTYRPTSVRIETYPLSRQRSHAGWAGLNTARR
jgi:hypothetical protein